MTIGFGIGIPVVSWGVIENFANNWSMDFARFFGFQFNYWGSLFVAAGYIGMVMLICQSKSKKTAAYTRPFAAAGRMAFTNYLVQTIICTLVFYGHGLGLFGRMERIGQILLVFVIWVLQLIISPIWLRHFKFGPAEWLWRSLTYKKFQPMRRSNN